MKNLKKYAIIITILFIIYFLLFLSNLNDYFLADELDFFKMNETNPFYFLYQGFNRKYYRPAGLLFLHGLFYIFYFNPIPYHVASIILHVANSFLIYHISTKFFKKESTSIMVLFMSIIFVSLYFEAIIWIASYFELFYVLFTLISIEYFLKYLEGEKKEKKYFLISNIFLTVGFLFKESVFFMLIGYLAYEVSRYNFFKLNDFWDNFKDLIKNNLIYLTYIPLVSLLFLDRFVINLAMDSTIGQFFEIDTIVLLVLGACAAIVLYWIFVNKIKNENLKFVLITMLLYSFLLIFHMKSRIFYFPCLLWGLSLGFLFEYFNYDIFLWVKEINTVKTKKSLISICLIVLTITTSGFFIVYEKNLYSTLSISTYNICRTIEDIPNGEQQDIFIVNLNYFGPWYYAMVGIFFEAELFVRTGKSYNITIAYINVGDTSPYNGNPKAIPLTINEYNTLTNRSLYPNNTFFLYDISLKNLINITNLNYSQW
ncbi:MAG: glycosyltransferase family 39 protein [Candidatus Helarchaeota archaeon]